jgi:hypothetical protein
MQFSSVLTSHGTFINSELLDSFFTLDDDLTEDEDFTLEELDDFLELEEPLLLDDVLDDEEAFLDPLDSADVPFWDSHEESSH